MSVMQPAIWDPENEHGTHDGPDGRLSVTSTDADQETGAVDVGRDEALAAGALLLVAWAVVRR